MTKSASADARKAVFLDRDGTLIDDVGYCADPAQVKLLDGVAELLPKLKSAGFLLIIITNQSGIGRGYFDEADFWRVQNEISRQLGDKLIDATYFCPDRPENATLKRKPAPGMILEAATELGIDLKQSYMVGDKVSDVEAGMRAGVKAAILVARVPEPAALFSGANLIAKNFSEVAEFILG
jgi:D-glycero-D-manno-heptose 1,7-bisphosphate phosphatase